MGKERRPPKYVPAPKPATSPAKAIQPARTGYFRCQNCGKRREDKDRQPALPDVWQCCRRCHNASFKRDEHKNPSGEIRPGVEDTAVLVVTDAEFFRMCNEIAEEGEGFIPPYRFAVGVQDKS